MIKQLFLWTGSKGLSDSDGWQIKSKTYIKCLVIVSPSLLNATGGLKLVFWPKVKMLILPPGTSSCLGWMTEADVASRCPRNTRLTGPVGSETRVAWTAERCRSAPRLENATFVLSGGGKTSHQSLCITAVAFSLWESWWLSSLSVSPQTSWSPAEYCKRMGDSCTIGCPCYFLVSFTLLKGRLKAWRHKITVPVLAAAEDYT